MNLSNEKITYWKSFYQHGDYIKIADLYCGVNQKISQKFARDLVREAFKFGVCRDNLYPVIEKYYAKIESQLKKVK